MLVNVRPDSGSASVIGAFVIVVLLVITAALIHVGAAVGARHRAQSAADLAALAGAAALVSGVEAACAAADSVAARNAATVDTCTVEDWDVTVQVSTRVAISIPGSSEAHAVARAGPVGE
nr:Rv3654c family TadE-like protein [Rhodococcus triatomae]